MIKILPSDLWIMLLCTVRYSMGRMTYITGTTKDLISTYSQHLTPHQRKQIRDEIVQELKQREERNSYLGMQMDHDCWCETVQYLEDLDKLEPSGFGASTQCFVKAIVVGKD